MTIGQIDCGGLAQTNVFQVSMISAVGLINSLSDRSSLLDSFIEGHAVVLSLPVHIGNQCADVDIVFRKFLPSIQLQDVSTSINLNRSIVQHTLSGLKPCATINNSSPYITFQRMGD